MRRARLQKADQVPLALVADDAGRVREVPGIQAAARRGRQVRRLTAGELIDLPPGGRLLLLPGRRAQGFEPGSRRPRGLEGLAVAAFVPPGHLVTALAAGLRQAGAPWLPLNCYAAVAWHRGRFRVAARRIDSDRRHDPGDCAPGELERLVEDALREHGGNRLFVHHGRRCALQYNCPNARNLFRGRWEAPAAVSPECNSACLGCISHQPGSSGFPAAQPRLEFVPTVEEIVELGAWHLERARRPLLSFGQGCEGEPLLQAELIAAAAARLRRRYRRGRLHVNTNGTLPEQLELCLAAGLDSVRVSLPAARPEYFAAYRGGHGPDLDAVRRSLRLAAARGAVLSVNLLVYPGVSDDPAELAALAELVAECRPRRLQWRNLNIDPDLYLENLACHGLKPAERPLGMRRLLAELRRRFPGLEHGCFNPLPD